MFRSGCYSLVDVTFSMIVIFSSSYVVAPGYLTKPHGRYNHQSKTDKQNQEHFSDSKTCHASPTTGMFQIDRDGIRK